MKKKERVLAFLLAGLMTISSIQITPLVAKADGDTQKNTTIKPVVQYNFDEMSGTTVKDITGNGNDGTLSGDAAWSSGDNDGGVSFSGNGYVSIPAGVMKGVHNVTVMMDYYVTKPVTNTWLFGLGPNSGTYIFMNSRNSSGKLGGGITNNGSSNGWQKEQDVSAALPSGWTNIALVISYDTKQELIYVNGVLAESRNDITVDPATMYNSSGSVSGYIAKSLYNGDPGFDGMVDNFRIYASALNSDEINTVVKATPTSVSPVTVTTNVGKTPELPTHTSAVYSDGTTKNVDVAWDAIPSDSYNKKGTFTVKGTTASGNLQVDATVYVMDKLTLQSNTITAHSVNVTWNDESDADKYNLYRSTDENGGYTLIYKGRDKSYTDTNLDESQKYYYKVTYTKNNMEANASDLISVTTKLGTPMTPVLSVDKYSDDTIALNWEAVHGADYYKLYRADSKDGAYTLIYNGVTKSYTDSARSPETAYFYKIEAYNTYGASDMSEPFTVSTRGSTVADWKMSKSEVVSGSAKEGNLLIKDASGNGNDIKEETYGTADDWSKYLDFSNDSMTGNAQSIEWTENAAKTKGVNTGADFITSSDAMINSENFTSGYTIELLYKFPSYWKTSQSWMSLLQRSGTANSMPEAQGTFNVAISNCKETQVESSNAADDKNGMFNSAWGVSMDEGDKWYEVTIVNDTKSLKVYVNGADGFRDITKETDPDANLVGIYANPTDGRFRIGAQYYSGALDKLMVGNLQEVRISDGALPKSNWLVPDPTQYLQNYGSNSQFTMHNSDDYSMAFFPDTQYEIEDMPQTMTANVNWLVNNAETNRIKSVVHLGDVVQVDDSQDENDRALNIFSQLYENGVALFMQPGNHDFYNSGGDFGEHSYDGISTYYRKNWGSASDYVKNFNGSVKDAQLVNDSPSGLSSYMIYNAGSYKYMVISLAWNQYTNNSANSDDSVWFENVLKNNSDIPTIVTSHTLFVCSPTDPSAIALDNSNEDGQNGTKIWNIVKKYNQVYLMIAGHNHGAGTMTLTNNSGNSVYGVLADYQFAYNGGNGWMKMIEYSESQNKIYISTFSPYAASLSTENKTFFDQNYLTGTGNYNEIDFDFSSRFSGMKASVYKENADAISTEIANLPNKITLQDKTNVDKVLADYNKLTNDEKPLVSNYTLLSADESLIQKQEDLAAAQTVINEISALPESITLKNKSDVMSIQSNYDALTKEQQAMVTNYEALIAAENTIAQEEKNQEAAQNVINTIAALPAIITTSNSVEVKEARKAYDALTDTQKALVSNYAILTQAEDAISKLNNIYVDATSTCTITIDSSVVPDGKTVMEIKDTIESAGDNYDNIVNSIMKNGYQSVMVNNITIIDMDGNEIHKLNGNATVSIKVPDGVDGTKLLVLYYNTDDGTVMNMNAVYQNGCLVFQTNHFSTYVLASVISVPDNKNAGSDNTLVPTTADATADNIAGKVINTSSSENNPNTGDNLIWTDYRFMLILMTLALISGAMVIGTKNIKRKEHDY